MSRGSITVPGIPIVPILPIIPIGLGARRWAPHRADPADATPPKKSAKICENLRLKPTLPGSVKAVTHLDQSPERIRAFVPWRQLRVRDVAVPCFDRDGKLTVIDQIPQADRRLAAGTRRPRLLPFARVPCKYHCPAHPRRVGDMESIALRAVRSCIAIGRSRLRDSFPGPW